MDELAVPSALEHVLLSAGASLIGRLGSGVLGFGSHVASAATSRVIIRPRQKPALTPRLCQIFLGICVILSFFMFVSALPST